MKTIKTALVAFLGAALLSTGAVAQDASSLSQLLRQIEQGQNQDSAEARRREAEFNSRKAEQTSLLNAARAERTAAEQLGARLEKQFEDNNAALAVKEEELTIALGELKELFGVLQQAAGDAQSVFGSSLTTLEYPDRADFLVALGTKMASSTNLASIEEIERLWIELQREVVESGKVKRFNAEIITADNKVATSEVVRIGNFSLINDDGFLEFKPNVGEDGVIQSLPRQPQGRYTSAASNVFGAQPGGTVVAGIDPTRGGVLATLVDTKGTIARINDGGFVGYCIIALGIVCLLIAVFLL